MVPFKGNDIESLNRNILNNEMDFSNPRIKLSSPLVRVLKGMLHKDPEKRITLWEIAKLLGFSLEREEERDCGFDEIAI